MNVRHIAHMAMRGNTEFSIHLPLISKYQNKQQYYGITVVKKSYGD